MNELQKKDMNVDAIFKDLTKKEEAFVRSYVNSGLQNHVDAARVAGYSEKTVSSQASQLIKRHKIRVAIGKYINSVVVADARNSMLIHMIKKYEALSSFNITEVMDIKTGRIRKEIKSEKDLTNTQQSAIVGVKERRYGKDGDEVVVELEFIKHTEADKFLQKLLSFSHAAEDARAQINIQQNAGDAGSGPPVINISVVGN